MEKKAAIALAIIVLGVLLLLSYSPPSDKSGSSLSISLENWPPEWYYYIADANGYFDDEGVEVKIIKSQDYPSSLSNFRKNLSIDCVSISTTDIFNLREDGISTRIVLISDSSIGADSLMSSPQIKSIEGLRGKKIGVEGFNSFSHIFVVNLLEAHNLSETDVSFMLVPAMQVPQAIASGKIDAGHTYEPATAEAVSLGQSKLADSRSLPRILFSGLACRERVFKDKLPSLQALVNGWFRAKEFEKKDQSGAHQIMARANGVPIEELEAGLAGNHLYGLEDNLEAFGTFDEGGIIWSLERTNEFLLERGQISGGVPVSELIDSRLIRNADAGAK